MRPGNVFQSRLCVLSVCVCLCLSVCLSVCLSYLCSGYNFWTASHRHFILVCRYIFTISSLILRIKIIGSRSMSYEKNDNFTYFNMLILCVWLQVIDNVMATHLGEGHIKVKVKLSSSFPILCQILLISTHQFSVCGYKSLIRSSSYIKVKVISWLK